MKHQINIAGEYEGENSFQFYGICSTNGLQTDKTKQTFFLMDKEFFKFNKVDWAGPHLRFPLWFLINISTYISGHLPIEVDMFSG